VISTALFDIETSDLDADKGIILCAVFKSSLNKDKIVYRTDELNPGWRTGKRGNDRAITECIVSTLKVHDVIVAHNGSGFDIPFVRTRAAYWKLPRVPDMKIIDPLQIAWRKFRLRSNRLGSISDFVGSANRKDTLDMSIWMDAVLNGTKASMDKIVNHCISDVDELDDVLKLVKPYVKVLDERGSAL
jgi:uncharacterized protein YprB with RNaseH-like and TPR domain